MSVAPSVPSSPDTIVSSRGLDLTGKIIPLLVTAFSLIGCVGGAYAAYTARQASLDTLIQERSGRAIETRAAVEDFKARLPVLETKEANNEKDIVEIKGSLVVISNDIKELLKRTPPK